MKKNRILSIFILIGIIASLILSINRTRIESHNKSVDITLDYTEIVKLSEQSDEDLSWWFTKFNQWGANSVTLNEETFESMIEEKKPIEVEILGNVFRDLNWKDTYPEKLVNFVEENGMDEYDVLVVTNSEALYNFIEEGLETRYSKNKYEIFQDEDQFIFLLDGIESQALHSKGVNIIDNNGKVFSEKKDLEGSKLLRLGLGYDKDKIQVIKDSGLEVVLRPYDVNPSWTEEKYIQANFNDYARYNIEPKYLIFTGNEILGYPDNIDMVRDFMLDKDMKVGLIESGVQREHIEQDGIEGLVGALDYNAIRVFSMPPYIQERYKFYNYSGAEEIENTLYRAVTERNIRLIYFRPFKEDKTTYVTDHEEYERTFKSFEERISHHNMVLGEASVMTPNYVNLVFKILIGIGIFGGGMILLESILSMSDRFKKLMIILGIPPIIAIPFVAPNFSVKLYALAAAIVFPSLSMVYLCSEMKTYYLKDKANGTIKESIILGIKTMITMGLITSIGALFVASLLSGIDYLLEMDVFRGVKIVQLLPIGIYSLVFLGYLGYKRDKSRNNKVEIKDVKDILNINIKVITVIIGVIALAIGYIYLARTGHETDIQPSNLEMIGRNFLELKLLARPRTKEFMLAFPAIMVGAYMMLNKHKLGMFVSGLVIAIGQTSIVNTFSHIRTPMYLSVIRTLYGVLFGTVLGIIYIILLVLGMKVLEILRGELFNE